VNNRRNRFLEAKKKGRERCREKKKRRKKRGEKEIKEIRTEEVWKYINRGRKKKESVSEEIAMQLLEGRKEGKAETLMKEKQTTPEEIEITQIRS
jgi:hypothetical protein